jgi:long-chain acyl-CoA synthetase
MNTTLTEKFKAVAGESAKEVAVLFREGGDIHAFTYGELFSASQKTANWLHRKGIRKGDKIAILLENRPEWCMIYFGILMSGAVAVPLDSRSGIDRIEYCLGQTGARVIFASGKADIDRIRERTPVKEVIVIGEKQTDEAAFTRFKEIVDAPQDAVELHEIAPEEIASIIFTSGTTGPPKGVMLTHKNFYANFQSISKMESITPADNFLSILPLHHSFAFMVTFLAPLFLKAKITFIDTLKADAILGCLREQKVTILALTPQILEYFQKSIREQFLNVFRGLGTILDFLLDLSFKVSHRIGLNPAGPFLSRIRSAIAPDLRYFICGGAKLDEATARYFFKLGFTVIEGYGLTETSPVVSLNPPEAPRIGSAGKPVEGVEIRISKPDEKGVGEVLVKGDNVMKGYYRDEEATREAIEGGWFHTGDLGYVDSEGYLFMRGRLKDIIVLSSGENVSAEEVKTYYEKASSIKEMHVMPGPDSSKLVAVIVPEVSYFRKSGESDIHGKIKWDVERLSEELEPFKRVRDFVISSNELPKTRLGKVQRHKAEKIYYEKEKEGFERRKPAAEEDLSAVGERTLEMLRKQTGAKTISIDDHLEIDLAIDSLSRIELMTSLERGFDIQIDEDRYQKIFTVRELIGYIEEKNPEGVHKPEALERPWDEILHEEPSPDILRRIGTKKSSLDRFVTVLSSMLLRFIFRRGFRLEVFGKEHLEEHSYIICPNHGSYLDGFLIFSLVPLPQRMRLFFMGYSAYFEAPVIRSIISLMRVIPVDSSRNLIQAMQASSHVLRRGNHLCIFPEGARSITGELRSFKKGAAILSKELKVGIIPAYISGSYEAWKPGTFLPRPRPIRVIFGARHSAEDLERKGNAVDPESRGYEAISLGLRQEVLELKHRLRTLWHSPR